MVSKGRRWLLPIGGLLLLWMVAAAVALLGAHREIRSGLQAVDGARKKADVSAVVDGRLRHAAGLRPRMTSPAASLRPRRRPA